MIIIPLAGESKRFQRIGIRTPKWALNVLDTPMIVWAIKSVVPIQEPGEEIILSVRQNNYRTLTKILNDTNFKNISIVKIENPTLGQAHTVKLTIDKKNYNPEERLIIWCGDCYIRNLEIFSRKKLENGIFVANLHGSHWSFSKIERDIIFLTAEKLRISDYANVGLYCFETLYDYLYFYQNLSTSIGELYVAPIYNLLINYGKKVNAFKIDSNDFYSFGTPEELNSSLYRLSKSTK